MINSYNELWQMKNSGVILAWDSITPEQLEYLFIHENCSDAMIANLYDIEMTKVRYKRKKYGILLCNPKYATDGLNLQEMLCSLNDDARERVAQKENIDKLAKAICHYVFRNGPVEDMHADGKLSDADMQTLNKYMVNKLAGILSLAMDNEWLKLEVMANFLSLYGTSWDPAEIDTADIDLMFNTAFELNSDDKTR